MPLIPNVDRTISPGNGWTLRVAIMMYGLYSASILVDGLAKKLKKAQDVRGIFAVLQRTWLFILLGSLGAYCILMFMLEVHFAAPSGSYRAWVCMLSIGHAVYCAAETQISFSRIPSRCLEKRKAMIFYIVIKFGILVAIVRTIINIVNISCWYEKSLDDPAWQRYASLDLATTMFNMVGSAYFFFTELYVCRLTVQISQLTTNQNTIKTMNMLAKANIYGFLAGLVDIADSYLQLQALEAVVLCLGMTAFIYYGHLLGLDQVASTQTLW